MNWEKLSPRDRMLVMSGGGVGALVLVIFLWSWYSSAVATREKSLQMVASDLTKKERKVLLGKKALRELNEFRARSLPSDPNVARSVYQKWLLELAGNAQLSDLNVAAVATRQIQGVGYMLTFNVKGETTLPQVVQLLESIERTNYLHRISRFSLRPLPNKKTLDIFLTLEAISVNQAEAVDDMPEVTQHRLAKETVEEYIAAVCGRNLFHSKNHAPAITSATTQTATQDREFSYTLKAKDPDNLDSVTYELEPNDLGATLDPKSGKLRWTPKELGTFQFNLRAIDDGLPPAEAVTTLTVTVEPYRPPAPPVEAPKKLAFDHAKYTTLIAVLLVDDRAEIWLHVRPTGQTLKLREGDKFEVGSIKGKVVSIGPDDFIFEVDGNKRKTMNGQTLEQAKPVS